MSDPMNGEATFITCPSDGEDLLCWWVVEDGAVAKRGQDFVPPIEQIGPLIALLPAEDTRIAAFDMPSMPAAQAEAAARHKATEASIDKQVLVAARALAVVPAEDGEAPLATPVLTAAASEARLAERLTLLGARGLDPDIILPVGLVLPEGLELDGALHPVSGQFGESGAIRHGRLVLPVDGFPVAALIGEEEAAAIHALDQAERDACLVSAAIDPPLDLRIGPFRRRTDLFRLDPHERKVLAALFGALLLVSIAIPLVIMLKYGWAADTVSEEALAAAKVHAPEAETAEAAEASIDAQLAARGLGGRVATVPLAGLMQAMQPAPTVMAREISAGEGLVSATLAAPQVDTLNQVLIAVQQAGFVVTATPRSDASGMSVADITVRAP